MPKHPQTIADLPTEHIEIIAFLFRRLVGTCDFHAIITKDEKTCLGEWLETIIHPLHYAGSEFPDFLPLLPPVPLGFDRWVYRGIAYASPHAIMVTSWDETTDPNWDPPFVFKTDGDRDTHYAEAVINHHEICRCCECIPH